MTESDKRRFHCCVAHAVSNEHEELETKFNTLDDDLQERLRMVLYHELENNKEMFNRIKLRINSLEDSMDITGEPTIEAEPEQEEETEPEFDSDEYAKLQDPVTEDG